MTIWAKGTTNVFSTQQCTIQYLMHIFVAEVGNSNSYIAVLAAHLLSYWYSKYAVNMPVYIKQHCAGFPAFRDLYKGIIPYTWQRLAIIHITYAQFRRCLDFDSDSRLTLKAWFWFQFQSLIPIPIAWVLQMFDSYSDSIISSHAVMLLSVNMARDVLPGQ